MTARNDGLFSDINERLETVYEGRVHALRVVVNDKSFHCAYLYLCMFVFKYVRVVMCMCVCVCVWLCMCVCVNGCVGVCVVGFFCFFYYYF